MIPRVAIVGGGSAGAVAAMVLAGRGIRVSVFEREPDVPSHVGDCLPSSFAPLIDKLGLRARLDAGPHARVHGNRVAWGSEECFDADSILNRNGAGWRLNRREFGAMLASAAMEHGADWNFGSTVGRCDWGESGWMLAVNGATITADFVIDATGRRASIARSLGVGRVRHDRLLAIAGEFQNGHLEDTFTLVEAVPAGWWYSGVLHDGRLSVIFATDAALPEYAHAKDIDGWQSLLCSTLHTAARVKSFAGSLLGPLRVWPAGSERLKSIAGDGWMAIGDAAAAHDPISSYGIGAAMGSGYYAAHAVAEILGGNADAGVAYVDVMQRSYDAYLTGCMEQYQRETRWPNAPFWKARQKGG